MLDHVLHHLDLDLELDKKRALLLLLLLLLLSYIDDDDPLMFCCSFYDEVWKPCEETVVEVEKTTSPNPSLAWILIWFWSCCGSYHGEPKSVLVKLVHLPQLQPEDDLDRLTCCFFFVFFPPKKKEPFGIYEVVVTSIFVFVARARARKNKNSATRNFLNSKIMLFLFFFGAQ
jgi:hypothetical protein